jgi:hypothetical protein
VDRLDTWLNAQRGRRRLAIIAIAWYISGVLIGLSAYIVVANSSYLAGAAWTPMPTVAIVAITVLAAPAGVGIGLMADASYARKARRPNRKKGLPPFLMWRQIALPWLLIPTELTAMFAGDQGLPRSDREALALTQVVFAVALIALSVELWRYSRRFTKPVGMATLDGITE